MDVREHDILIQAIEGFRKEVKINIEIGNQEVRQDDKLIDATLIINLHGKLDEYWAEVKPTVTDVNVGHLAQQFEGNLKKWILVTRYVQPKVAKTLRELKIQFIDTVGNVYINDPPAFIFIHGNKLQRPLEFKLEEGMLGRAGIHVIFALLCKRELCNANYREIAEQGQVALGTVSGVMKDLATQGFLIDTDDKQRRLIRKKELLDKWLTAYAEKLRPKKLIGKYTGTKPDFWQQAELGIYNAQWGGEVAAHLLARYLKPEIITIYARKPIQNLTLGLKLRQDRNGNVELRERFWKCETPDIDQTIVPPLLVYADLMATGDTRNIETAKIIYSDYLKGIFFEG